MSNAAVVSFSPPLSVQAGQHFTVPLTLQNTGPDLWVSGRTDSSTAYKLGTYPHDSLLWGPTRVVLPNDVMANALVTIPIPCVAPQGLGPQTFAWQMVHEGIAWFGEIPSVTINVTAAPPTPLSTVLTAARSALEPQSGTVVPGSNTPCVWNSGVYIADGIWRTRDFVNDYASLNLEVVQTYLWTGIQTGGICDTHVQVTAVDLDGEERLVNLIQWDHYAEPTTFQGRFQQPPFPVVIQPGELLRFGWFTAPMGGKVAQHLGNVWVLRG